MKRVQGCGKDMYAYMSKTFFLIHKKRRRVQNVGLYLVLQIVGNVLFLSLLFWWVESTLDCWCPRACMQRAWVPPRVQHGDASSPKAACAPACALVWNWPLLAFRLMVLSSAQAQKYLSVEWVCPAKGKRLLGAEEFLRAQDITPDVPACLTFT